jgi:hypothetical protein
LIYLRLPGDWRSWIVTETYGSIRAPSLKLEISQQPTDLRYIDWDTSTDFSITAGGILVWSLYDNGNLLYQSSDYTVSPDGSTASFSHTFPPLDNGDTFTVKQDVAIAMP